MSKWLISSLCLWLSVSFSTNCQSLELRPLTNKILMLHFDEGSVDYPMNGQSADNYQVNRQALNIPAASALANYSIESADDPNYSSEQSPTNLYRKSKPTEFTNSCDTWDFIPYYNTFGCVNLSDDHIEEHWIYLELPTALQVGNSYTLALNSSILSNGLLEFTYLPSETLSDAVHVNNVGYSTEAGKKYGYVYHWMGDGGSLDLSSFNGNNFQILDANSGNSVFTGSLNFRKDEFAIETLRQDPGETPNQNFLGAEVYECDFSSFNNPGQYQLYVEGIGSSFPFEISCNVYRRPFELAMQGLFINRSGQEIGSPFAEIDRPAPHHPVETPGFNGQLVYSSTTVCEVTAPDADIVDSLAYTSGIQGLLSNSWGWYQDAGDWDGYLSHFQIPIMLMFLDEHFPENFVDAQLNIPSSGNNLPDILDEARWLIRFYKRLKDETESQAWTSGGVPGGRIFADLWGEDFGPQNIVRGSWQDTDRQWVVSGEDAFTSYYYAGAAAHYHFLMTEQGFSDPEGIDWEQEAIDAYAWASSNSTAGDFCHDFQRHDARAYAAASLYRLTGNTTYDNDFQNAWNNMLTAGFDQLTGYQAFGPNVYASITEYSINPTTESEVATWIEQTADIQLLNNIDDRACRWGGNIFFPMLSGHATTPYVFEGLLGYVYLKDSNPTKAQQYWDNLHTTADYFLGTGALRKTWLTGAGENQPEHVFHLDSYASGTGEPKDGLMTYGPWRNESFGAPTPSNHMWASQWAYPEYNTWPGHERWFSQRTSPLATEFTIHQNTINAAVLYGALSSPFNCSSVVGVQDLLASDDCLELFPNPVEDFFILQGELGFYDITILDLNGQTVLTLPSEGSEIRIDVSSLGPGMFFVNVKHQNDEVCVRKILKM